MTLRVRHLAILVTHVAYDPERDAIRQENEEQMLPSIQFTGQNFNLLPEIVYCKRSQMSSSKPERQLQMSYGTGLPAMGPKWYSKPNECTHLRSEMERHIQLFII